MFCPNCRSLVIPKAGTVACKKCGYEGEVGEADPDDTVTSRAEEREVVILEGDTLGTMPKTKQQCPECGHGEAHYKLLQTRKADEPETMILTCPECKHRWRKY